MRRLPRIVGTVRIVNFSLFGFAELRNLFILIGGSILLDVTLLSKLSDVPWFDALRRVISWFFGSGTTTPEDSWPSYCCLALSGFLGYIVLGLVVFVISNATMEAYKPLDKERTPTAGQILEAVIWTSSHNSTEKEMSSRKWFVISVVAVIVLAAVLYFWRRSDPIVDEAVALRFAQLPITYSAVTHLAEALGHYDTAKLNYFTLSVPAGPDVVGALRNDGSSGANAGGIAVTPVVTMIGAGAKPIVLATTILSNERVRIVTFSGTGITEDAASLRGMRVGVVRNTVGEIYLSRVLDKGGLVEDDVTLVSGRPADLRNLLLDGSLDAAVLWDPFVTQSVKVYTKRRSDGSTEDRGDPIVLLDPSLYDLAFNVVTTESKLREARPQLVEMLKGVILAGDFAESDRKKAQMMLEEWLDLEDGDLDNFMSTTKFKVYLDTSQMKKWMREEMEWLKRRQPDIVIPDDFSPYIDTSLLKELDASRVTE